MDVTTLWNFADPATSEAAFRSALATATNADDALVLQTQIARTYSLRSRFADAHALLDAIAPALASAGAEPRVRAMLERGRTWRSAKEPETMPLMPAMRPFPIKRREALPPMRAPPASDSQGVKLDMDRS